MHAQDLNLGWLLFLKHLDSPAFTNVTQQTLSGWVHKQSYQFLSIVAFPFFKLYNASGKKNLLFSLLFLPNQVEYSDPELNLPLNSKYIEFDTQAVILFLERQYSNIYSLSKFLQKFKIVLIQSILYSTLKHNRYLFLNLGRSTMQLLLELIRIFQDKIAFTQGDKKKIRLQHFP